MLGLLGPLNNRVALVFGSLKVRTSAPPVVDSICMMLVADRLAP
jgi:hypothetical protein